MASLNQQASIIAQKDSAGINATGSNLSPRISQDRRRGGSGLTMLKSINSNQTSYIVGCGQTEDNRLSRLGAAGLPDPQDILSENEAENLAAPAQGNQTSVSSFCESEVEEAGSPIVLKIKRSLLQQPDDIVLKPDGSDDSDDQSANNAYLPSSEEAAVKQPSPEKPKEPSSPLKRMELGGILVYDSYARMTGSLKLTKYYSSQPAPRVDPYIIFSKEQVSKATNDLFSREARERDFANELDKQFYQRMPRIDMKNKELKVPQYQISVPPLHNMLIFDSRFESGNLRKAAKVNNIEYNLWLENDMNTRGHTQWFFFKVVFQSDKPSRITMNILNLAKTFSLFKVGMKPVVFSLKKYLQHYPQTDTENFDPANHKDGWQRACENIKYFQNEIQRSNDPKFASNANNDKFLTNNNGCGEGTENYYTLSFEYKFEHPDDEVWFAHAVPYTYTAMQNSVKSQLQDEQNSQYLRADILCNTLGGLPVPMLTITDKVKSYMSYQEQISLQTEVQPYVRKSFKQKYQDGRKIMKLWEEERKPKAQMQLCQQFEEEFQQWLDYNQQTLSQNKFFGSDFGSKLLQYCKDHSQKRCVVLTSRVHPGEPQASHMLEGTLQMLLSNTPLAKELRKHFVFKVVPMLNPDGVVFGNYRCSLLGCDLNRKWLHPNKFLHPTIYYSKQLIRYTHWERKVIVYCDMHGHSRKQNVFFYGCSYKNYEQEGRIKNAQLRILPLLCCHKNNNFSFAGSSFKIEKAKESTGRVVVFREFNIMNSFTLECSFHGKQSPDGKIQHMSPQDMRDIGSCLVQQLENYLPHEQYKLNIIGSKVLDIFYDEFVKFVPAYILKREKEEEQNQQLQLPQSSVQLTTYKLKKLNTKKLPSQKITGLSNAAIVLKKSSGNRKRKTEEESPSEHMSDFGKDSQQDRTTKDVDLPDFQEFEQFINHTYKRGKEHDVDDSSSDEAVTGYLRPAKLQSKLPYIKNGKKQNTQKAIRIAVEKGTAPASGDPPTRKDTQIIKLNQIVPQQVMSLTQQIPHNHNNRALRPDKESSQPGGMQSDMAITGTGSKSSSSRIHPQLKQQQFNDDYKGQQFVHPSNQIVEYVVDGKRIRVQKNIKQVKSPQNQESDQGSYHTNDATQSARNNKLGGHGILKRLPTTEVQNPKPIVNDYRGVKSFTEYAERLSHQKQQSQDHTQSSFFIDTQAPKHYQTFKQQPEQAQVDFDQAEQIQNSKRRSNQTNYTPTQAHTEQYGKSKALQMIQQAQLAVQTQPSQAQLQGSAVRRTTGLEVLTNQIKSNGGTVIKEQLMEAHRKLTQLDRESIMGVGFQIKMRPQAKTDSSSGNNPVLSVKSTQSQKKRQDQVVNPNITHIAGQALNKINQSAQLKLMSSRSQDPQEEITRFQSNDKRKLGTQMMVNTQQQQQLGPNGKPMSTLVCPIKTKMQTSALRTHLKHKRNVQVPLPLHQQERIAAQEQNQLYPATVSKADSQNQSQRGCKEARVSSPKTKKQVGKQTTEHSLPGPAQMPPGGVSREPTPAEKQQLANQGQTRNLQSQLPGRNASHTMF